MSFDVPKIHKWADNIENTLTEWAHEHIEVYYGIDSVEELTQDQISEIEEYVNSLEDTWYQYVGIGFKNVINWLESENYEYD